ncbi:MAG: cupin domain-containing protein [bacterium]|nr:cupin domain-containing protein [bacterium]MXV90467.1 cupin domain-containing protein [Acidimicrobiia bacterium]MYC44875.1 cupin domain-containing protein [Acidimicrobiia bacterium]MYI18533.1 cupin domain-containing protein [Acidimicrobiia bacterium]
MSEDRVQVVRGSAEPVPLPLIASGGEALAVVWPGVGSQHRSLHRLLLEPGGRTIDLQHPSESVYYVRAGSVTVTDGDDGAQHALVEGSMVHVDPSTAHRFEAGADGAEIVGGPCPPDPSIYESREV